MAIDYDKMNERIQLVSQRLAELNKPAISRDAEMALALATLANLAVDLLTCVQDLDERLSGETVVGLSGRAKGTTKNRPPQLTGFSSAEEAAKARDFWREEPKP